MNRLCVSVSLCALLIGAAANAATFTVTNTNDTGSGSLRQAIIDGVAATVGNAAHDTVIAFNIPGPGVHTIRPASPLPPIKDLLIDGYTQPGSRANTLAKGSDAILLIEIDGTNAGAGADGLVNQGTVPGAGVPFVGIRGLVINRFSGAGIRVYGPGGAGYPGYITVQGCYIGTDASGVQARGNGVGILLESDGQALIGEVTPDFGGNTVPWPAYRNVVSGNVGAGIAFASTDPLNPAVGTVRNAYIGTTASGLVALGNGGDGIAISADAAMGSQSFGSFIYLHDNVIAANHGDGIDTQGIGTQAFANTIGSGVDGASFGNQGHGAYFHGNSIGSIAAPFGQPGVPGPGIAHNGGAGVRIADGAIADVGGPIYANVGLGIDIGTSGPDTNDAGDADAGPNERLNFPVIATAAVASGVAGTHIQGTINTRPNSQFQVRLYANSACNASGYGEAERMIDTGINVTTDASGNGVFDKQLAFTLDPAVYPVVTALIRRFAEGTYPVSPAIIVSEFSACAPVTGGTPLPTLAINDVTVTEGNSGTTTATFAVTLSTAATSAVTVNYATANGTATVGSDYVATSGALTFAAGQTTKAIAVTINGDTTIEPNETFVVNLSAASGATIADAQGIGTITNDDAALPALSIDDVTVTEGNSGSTTATFTVTLSAASASPVTLNYATANGTATAGSDYIATSGTLIFAAGQVTKTIAVTIEGDTTLEADETYFIDLSAATGATITKTQGAGTITNDDVATPSPGGGGGSGGGGGGGGGGSMDIEFLLALALVAWLNMRQLNKPRMVRPAGVEPATYRLGGGRSIH